MQRTDQRGLQECGFPAVQGGAPIADNTPEAIAQSRKATESAMRAFSNKPIEDVPGLGKADFFVPGINQMNALLDGERPVLLSVGPALRDRARDIAVDMARKLAD